MEQGSPHDEQDMSSLDIYDTYASLEPSSLDNGHFHTDAEGTSSISPFDSELPYTVMTSAARTRPGHPAFTPFWKRGVALPLAPDNNTAISVVDTRPTTVHALMRSSAASGPAETSSSAQECIPRQPREDPGLQSDPSQAAHLYTMALRLLRPSCGASFAASGQLGSVDQRRPSMMDYPGRMQTFALGSSSDNTDDDDEKIPQYAITSDRASMYASSRWVDQSVTIAPLRFLHNRSGTMRSVSDLQTPTVQTFRGLRAGHGDSTGMSAHAAIEDRDLQLQVSPRSRTFTESSASTFASSVATTSQNEHSERSVFDDDDGPHSGVDPAATHTQSFPNSVEPRMRRGKTGGVKLNYDEKRIRNRESSQRFRDRAKERMSEVKRHVTRLDNRILMLEAELAHARRHPSVASLDMHDVMQALRGENEQLRQDVRVLFEENQQLRNRANNRLSCASDGHDSGFAAPPSGPYLNLCGDDAGFELGSSGHLVRSRPLSMASDTLIPRSNVATLSRSVSDGGQRTYCGSDGTASLARSISNGSAGSHGSLGIQSAFGDVSLSSSNLAAAAQFPGLFAEQRQMSDLVLSTRADRVHPSLQADAGNQPTLADFQFSGYGAQGR